MYLFHHPSLLSCSLIGSLASLQSSYGQSMACRPNSQTHPHCIQSKAGHRLATLTLHGVCGLLHWHQAPRQPEIHPRVCWLAAAVDCVCKAKWFVAGSQAEPCVALGLYTGLFMFHPRLPVSLCSPETPTLLPTYTVISFQGCSLTIIIIIGRPQAIA